MTNKDLILDALMGIAILVSFVFCCWICYWFGGGLIMLDEIVMVLWVAIIVIAVIKA